jgi:alpha-glucan,water dikinase
LLEFGIS